MSDEAVAPGIGLFWGDEPDAASPRLPSLPVPATPPRKRDAAVRPRKSVSLPLLRHGSSTQLVLASDPASVSAHDSTLSLLTVLQTLWRSIAKDAHAFIQQIVDGKEISVADHKYINTPYYSGGAYNEDKPYFLHEKQVELQRETVRKQTQAYRELHCASDDRQHYLFDRRSRRPPSEVAARKKTSRDERTLIENRLIERHEHKIQHLLHVLQTEMANETQREIRALAVWSPHKPLSRQGKRHVSTIIRERYEAADRIMRILEVEDYHIVIGVDAAKYLEDTIARGAALKI